MFLFFAFLAILGVVIAMPPYGSPPAAAPPQQYPQLGQPQAYPLKYKRMWIQQEPRHYHPPFFYQGYPGGWFPPVWDFTLSNPFYTGRHHRRHRRRHSSSDSRRHSGRRCNSRDSRDC
ncbi:hypothetical protein RB195_025767 [Necator americanus]|uniref:Spore coat protein T domain protein n=1 Tax=Necator americanus TaxID=51031 RepID=A0ABR1EUD3_NECAM